MKKSILFFAGIVGLSLASCDDTSDLGKPQVNQPPVVIEANGVKATASAVLNAPAINLNDYQNINIPILDITLAGDFPQDATVAGVFQVADNENFENAVEIPITAEVVKTEATKAEEEEEPVIAPNPGPAVSAPRKFIGVIEGNLWEDAFVQYFKYNPSAQDNYYRYVLYTQIGTQVTELTGGYVDGRKILVTPVDMKYAIADDYYVYGKYIGGNNITTAEQMKHSDTHKYDDPVFSYTVKVEPSQVSDFTWVVAGKDAPDAQVYGVVDPAASNGLLRPLSEGGKPGQISMEGPWTIEVNMLSKTYSIRLAAESLYVYGPASNNFTYALQLATDNFTTYYGFGVIKTSFRLSSEKSLNSGVKYGAGEAQGTLVAGDNVEAITVSEARANTLYYINADVVKLTYNLTKIDTVGLIGLNGDWDNDIVMKGDKNKVKYSATVTTTGATEFKFRFNKKWDINLGGALDNLTFGGDNIAIPEAGEYNITLDFTTLPYSATVVKK
ncbi:MAG: hypothetical protein K2M03_02610 [Muribaculaceae bacterium]|nr:hypothetical protein [Muribaculaceae bacterium]